MSEGSATASDHGRRNRLIAIAAGAITVVAIVLGFAGDVLGLPWHWMRPAAELLLLAELVGLVVLERHQLFEPVSEKVDDVQSRVGTVQTRVDEIHAMMTENVRSSGQVTPCASVTDVARRGAQALREALARDQQAPQILRMARLGGLLVRGANVEEDQGPAAELQELLDALKAYSVTLDTPPDARSRRWSVRVIFAVATSRSFDLYLQQNMRSLYAGKPSNVEYKALVRSRIETTLSPAVATSSVPERSPDLQRM